MDSTISKLITPEQVVQFERSRPALTAIRQLAALSEIPEMAVSQSSFTHIQSYLIALICLKNANRSGVVANMTLSELDNAGLVDGSYIISVAKQKTASTMGSARIIANNGVHSWSDAELGLLYDIHHGRCATSIATDVV